MTECPSYKMIYTIQPGDIIVHYYDGESRKVYSILIPTSFV